MALASIGSGIGRDFLNRLPYYSHDWTCIYNQKWRVLAASVYIFLASALPALAFGEQFTAETNGLVNIVHVLSSTTIAGVVQALVGGQPLLIVGVAEPIVLVYKYMYDFAENRDDLGSEQFLAWAAWVCVWAALMVVLLALTNACLYISKFTRYAGEAFGLLIALLFFQQAIKGLVDEFSSPDDETADSQWKLVNGLWSLFLAFGLVLTSLLIRKARRWCFLNAPSRSFLADYGVPLLLIAWAGLSYAVSGPDVPMRVNTPSIWQVKDTWTVAADMSNISSKYIAAALVPALIIAILFFFDHNVSSQLAQQEEFGLVKPSAYHYDMLLLGFLTALCGLIGLPPVNGVIPQSPMHTKALAILKGTTTANENENIQVNEGQKVEDSRNALSVEATSGSPSPLSHGQNVVSLSVVEQRGSNLLQALLVAACLPAIPAIRCLPRALLWGYFAFMAIESLPGSQLWDRTLLLFTDPARRHLILESGHAPYLEIVPFRTIQLFTILQLLVVGGVYGLTWAGLAGVLFPIPIMLLVPFRQYILPRIFRNKVHLEALDALHEEQAGPLPRERAVAVATEAGLGVVSRGLSDVSGVLDEEMHHYRVIHHLSEEEIEQRRRSMGDGGSAVVGLTQRRPRRLGIGDNLEDGMLP